MTWVKLDDGMFLNPKIGHASLEALGVYALSLTYAAHNLTDGRVPVTALHLLRCTEPISTELVRIGLWEADSNASEGAFRIHDYLKYNPSRRKVLRERQKTKDRVTAFRTKKKRARNAVTNDGVTPPPVPVPLKREKPSRNGFRPEVLKLCQLLADLIARNGSKRPDPEQVGWLNAARLMLDRDERDEAEAERLIRWCQADEFWRGNILSMPKFRQQYDKLRLRARAGAAANPQDDGW